jgi:hypothetical protein
MSFSVAVMPDEAGRAAHPQIDLAHRQGPFVGSIQPPLEQVRPSPGLEDRVTRRIEDAREGDFALALRRNFQNIGHR